ncbi:hypothetical protein P280DRAFT_468653, partial [Massarina eburnea CBS 473.64]
MAIALKALSRRVRIAWTFRIQCLLTIVTGLSAAWMLKDRGPLGNVPFVDLSMFRSLPYIAVFIAKSIGNFALFVSSYFLPLFTQSIGLSWSTGEVSVAAFNACSAVGRFVAGALCDKIGLVKGMANSSLFTTLPTVVAAMFGPDMAAMVIGMAVTGWTEGASDGYADRWIPPTIQAAGG